MAGLVAGASVVSLYIPGVTWGYDVPITASNAGTDGSGHTTWVIAEGTPSGTFTSMITGPVQPCTSLLRLERPILASLSCDFSLASME